MRGKREAARTSEETERGQQRVFHQHSALTCLTPCRLTQVNLAPVTESDHAELGSFVEEGVPELPEGPGYLLASCGARDEGAWWDNLRPVFCPDSLRLCGD
ncbi:unnamed protein product [Rangifer tarandus platyrhynchus]|uniref:Uncharacterized protein n=1 Tax=Rangifer tarandus platyrhynchus TaxID=3082113 RepID=A0AC59ZJI3_RANTA